MQDESKQASAILSFIQQIKEQQGHLGEEISLVKENIDPILIHYPEVENGECGKLNQQSDMCELENELNEILEKVISSKTELINLRERIRL